MILSAGILHLRFQFKLIGDRSTRGNQSTERALEPSGFSVSSRARGLTAVQWAHLASYTVYEPPQAKPQNWETILLEQKNIHMIFTEPVSRHRKVVDAWAELFQEMDCTARKVIARFFSIMFVASIDPKEPMPFFRSFPV